MWSNFANGLFEEQGSLRFKNNIQELKNTIPTNNDLDDLDYKLERIERQQIEINKKINTLQEIIISPTISQSEKLKIEGNIITLRMYLKDLSDVIALINARLAIVEPTSVGGNKRRKTIKKRKSYKKRRLYKKKRSYKKKK
jgi:hypothetical protein